MHIRPDLVGVVYVDGHTLAAGDVVPDGVTVGDHLIVKESSSGGTSKPRRRGNTSRATSDD